MGTRCISGPLRGGPDGHQTLADLIATMNEQTFDLATLISPVSPGPFFSQYWERQPLHLQRHDEGFYRGLISNRDLENFISQSNARYPAIRLIKNGAYFPPEAYTRDIKSGDESFDGVPDVQKTRPNTETELPCACQVCSGHSARLGQCARSPSESSIMPCTPTRT